MKITFLGTSHGVPSAERFCSCVMIESGGAYYLIDAGAPVVELLLRYGVDMHDVRAVFTTHIHGDHTAGIPHLADLFNWYYTDCAVDLYLTEQPLIDATKALIAASDPHGTLATERVRFHLTDPVAGYADEHIRIDYIPTAHMGSDHASYAILVTEGNRRVLFSGDLSGKLKAADVPAILAEEPLDAFVCELAHFGIAELQPYLEACRAKAVYFTHVYPLAKYEDIHRLSGKLPFAIHTPTDGDTVEIG